jgi:hypothetical protein
MKERRRCASHSFTMASVIRVMEGRLARCLALASGIATREVRDAMAEILENATLAVVCRKVDSARQKQRGPVVATYEI